MRARRPKTPTLVAVTLAAVLSGANGTGYGHRATIPEKVNDHQRGRLRSPTAPSLGTGRATSSSGTTWRGSQRAPTTDRGTITEICFLVGFESVGSFSSRFRDLAGMSPTEYRSASARAPPIPGCFVLIDLPAHVNFGFWRGVEVDCGRGILQTGGLKMAHINLQRVFRHRPCRPCGDCP